jgi:hypothetical protein
MYSNEMQELVEEFNKRDLIWPLLRLAFTFPSKYLRLLLDKFLAQVTKKGTNISQKVRETLRRQDVDIEEQVKGMHELKTELEIILARNEIRRDLESQEINLQDLNLLEHGKND